MKNAFLDTNVILYLVDRSAPEKQKRARELLKSKDWQFSISVQVLQEFYWIATRKLRIAPNDVREEVEVWSRKRVIQPGPEFVVRAIDTSERYRIAFWDALIVEAAVSARADVLFTEDLNHDQAIRGVRIKNPFAA